LPAAERDLIRARTGEGRERAKARGVKMGRKPKLTPHQQSEAIKRRDAGEPIREIARSYNVIEQRRDVGIVDLGLVQPPRFLPG
jgi:DNA invertase Pin-like site-specific DNA recombinase